MVGRGHFLEVLPGPVADRGPGPVLHPALPAEHPEREPVPQGRQPAPRNGCSARTTPARSSTAGASPTSARTWRPIQSIVYNKAALVFLMLKEMLGEEELLQRLRQVLIEFKYQSLATARFIQQSQPGRSPRLQKFFNGWIYSRELPEVRYEVAISGAGRRDHVHPERQRFRFPGQRPRQHRRRQVRAHPDRGGKGPEIQDIWKMRPSCPSTSRRWFRRST